MPQCYAYIARLVFNISGKSWAQTRPFCIPGNPHSLLDSIADISLISSAAFQETPFRGLYFILRCFAETHVMTAGNLSWKLIYMGDSRQYPDICVLNSVVLGTLFTVHNVTSTNGRHDFEAVLTPVRNMSIITAELIWPHHNDLHQR